MRRMFSTMEKIVPHTLGSLDSFRTIAVTAQMFLLKYSLLFYIFLHLRGIL